MGNKGSKSNATPLEENDVASMHSNLINMGFNESHSMKAANKYPNNLNKAIDYINNAMTKNRKSNDTLIKSQENPEFSQNTNAEEETSVENDIIDQQMVISKWDKIKMADCKSTDTENIEITKNENELTLNQCGNVERLLFLIQFYNVWTHYKISNKLPKKSFISIRDFITSLNGYSYHGIWNDFHHLRRYHNNDYVYSYFKLNCQSHNDHNMNCCEYNCKSLERNTRDRAKCKDKIYRRKLYFICNEKQQIENEQEEMNYQNLLDTIHSYLLHYDLNTMVLTDKFVTNLTTDNDTEAKQDFNKGGEYGFGVGFTYCNKKWNHYCPTKYSSLKEELLVNKIYALDLFTFNLLLNAAENYMKTDYCKTMKAIDDSTWNVHLNISKHTPISANHIFVLMSYTNHDKLQRSFKSTYRKLYYGETRQKIIKRHQEIANWAGLMLESIFMYSDVTKRNSNRIFYHGIDCKLKFSKFQVGFLIPTSTTIKQQIAYNFASTNGIIICMKPLNRARYLNVSFLSDFPKEEERLICNNVWQFVDIIHKGISNKYYIKCLVLYQKIVNGAYIAHDKQVFNILHQKSLIQLMINYMDTKQHKQLTYKNVSSYLQSLFNYCSDRLKVIWINQSEFHQCIPQLQKYIKIGTLTPGVFAEFLRKTNNVKLKKIPYTQLCISKEEIKKLVDGKTSNSCNIKCDLDHFSDKMNGEYVIFQISLQRNLDDLILTVVEKPNFISRLEFEFDCREPKFGYYNSSREQFEGTNIIYGLVFEKSQRIHELCLDFVFRIISCTDQHGNENEFIET